MAGPGFRPGRPPYPADRVHGAYRAYRGGRSAWRVVRRVPPPLLLVVGVIGVSMLLVAIAVLFSLAVIVGTLAAPVLIVRGVRRSIRHGRQHQQLGAPARGPVHGRMHGPALAAAPPRPPVDRWRQAKQRFAALRSEYAAYECDALAVLRLPALADVTVPSTARFIEAFAQAQALDVDSPPDQRHRELFVSAVQLACQSWQAAREAAERIRDSHLPAEERSAIERVVRLLTTARDTDNDAERLVAYSKARSELSKLERTGHIRIPRPAQAALDNAYRGQLPA